MSKYYHKNILNGLCGLCAKPSTSKICKVCHDKAAIRTNKRRKLARKNGMCGVCITKPSIKNASQCQECLDRSAAIQRDRRAVAKIDALNAYGGPKCFCCGESNRKFLTIDHADGGGSEHRAAIGKGATGSGFYLWLRKNKYPDGFQVLCWNCNSGRQLNNGICPHNDPS